MLRRILSDSPAQFNTPSGRFGDTVYGWECRYCDASFTWQSPGEANRAGRDHLLEHHRTELEQRYLRSITGKHCQSGCGYQFPHNPDAVEGFVCPQCSTDYIVYFTGKDLWAGVERRRR